MKNKQIIFTVLFTIGMCIATGPGSVAFGAIHSHHVNHKNVSQAHPEAYKLNYSHPAAGKALVGCSWSEGC